MLRSTRSRSVGIATMSELLPDERDDAIGAALIEGRSLTAVRKQFGLSLDELDEALTKLWPLDAKSRIRMIKRDAGQIQHLAQIFYSKACEGDAQAGLLCVKIWERLHELLGLSADRRLDVTILSAPPPASVGFERVRAVIEEVARGRLMNGSAPSLPEPLSDADAVDALSKKPASDTSH